MRTTRNSLAFRIDRVPTPIGTALVVMDEDEQIRAFDWEDHEDRAHRLLHRHYGEQHVSLMPGHAPSVRAALEAYFDGDLDALAELPVATNGTPFQRQVWAALRAIPPGETLSYGRLAERLGQPRAARAVGLANGSNPIGLVVPCHRVIGADGSLTGYGGGIERKRWLLAHEGAATVDVASHG
jgi:methylated-DNA-[protein]-cysteine S-methyltransferase